jgi:hypothetical protein
VAVQFAFLLGVLPEAAIHILEDRNVRDDPLDLAAFFNKLDEFDLLQNAEHFGEGE